MAMLKSYKTLLIFLLISQGIVNGGTLKIQYSKQKVEDAYVINLSHDPNTSGNEWSRITYYTSNNRIERSYIRIPIPEFISSDIATSVTNAELKLYFGDLYNNASPFSIDLHKVESTWDESSLVWSNQPSFYDTPETTRIQSSSPMWVSFPISDLVKSWISGAQSNYGVMLRPTFEGPPTQNTTIFRTSEYDDPAFRPILEISSPDFPDTLITDVSGSPPDNEYHVDQHTMALWHFNEGAGSTSIDSTNNYADATLHNGAAWTSGRFGSAIALDGINDYLSFTNESLFNFGQGDSFTLEFWIKILSNDQLDNKWIFSKKTDVNNVGFGIWIDNQNFLKARVNDNTLIGQPLDGSQLTLNQWHNIVFIRGGFNDRLKFYVDGILVADAIDPTASLVNTVPFYLGRSGRTNNWNSTCINAIIDEVRISQIARTITSVKQVGNQIPKRFSLKQNYPNPFNPSTTIQFNITKRAPVKLKIYDLRGREVATLVDEMLASGNHSAVFEAARLPSGIYFSRLQAGEFVQTRKLTLLK